MLSLISMTLLGPRARPNRSKRRHRKPRTRIAQPETPVEDEEMSERPDADELRRRRQSYYDPAASETRDADRRPSTRTPATPRSGRNQQTGEQKSTKQPSHEREHKHADRDRDSNRDPDRDRRANDARPAAGIRVGRDNRKSLVVEKKSGQPGRDENRRASRSDHARRRDHGRRRTASPAPQPRQARRDKTESKSESTNKSEDNASEAPAPAPRLVDCLTCGADDIPRNESFKLECDHRMCHDCIKRVFELSTTDPATMPPKCCTDTPIPWERVERIFDDKFKAKWTRKRQEFSTENRIYCPSKPCGRWIKPSHIHLERGGRPVANCPRCKTKVCVHCHQRMHASRECPKDPEISKLMATAKDEGWQRCYACQALVERREGCNHMTCRCRAEFCITCGAKWKTCDCPLFTREEVERHIELERQGAGQQPPPHHDWMRALEAEWLQRGEDLIEHLRQEQRNRPEESVRRRGEGGARHGDGPRPQQRPDMNRRAQEEPNQPQRERGNRNRPEPQMAMGGPRGDRRQSERERQERDDLELARRLQFADMEEGGEQYDGEEDALEHPHVPGAWGYEDNRDRYQDHAAGWGDMAGQRNNIAPVLDRGAEEIRRRWGYGT